MAVADERRVRLVDEADVDGFRQAARQLLVEGIEPLRVVWEVESSAGRDLFADDAGSPRPAQANAAAGEESLVTAAARRPELPAASFKVPAFFVPLCAHAGLHADPGRFGLLYRLLWRLIHEPGLRDDALDPDRLEAEKMARMVRRDMHKMTAFVRFRPVGGSGSGGNSSSAGSGVSSGSGGSSSGVSGGSGSGSGSGGGGGGGGGNDGPASDAEEGLESAGASSATPLAMAPASELPTSTRGAFETGAVHADAGADANADVDANAITIADAEADTEAIADADAEADTEAASRWHVAWFEPVHHIVAATAPFFARRFAQLKWAILTPERCVRWDGRNLAFGPGANRDEAPSADAGEQLWLTYYAHIFNPARLKLAMMQKEMPRRYWHNLPEAALIQPLTVAAATRSGQMVAQAASEPAHRRPTASLAMRIDSRAAVATATSTLATSTSTSTSTPATSTSTSAMSASTGLTLPALGLALNACRECPIGALATQAVPGNGPPEVRLMLVGEQPGDQEDLRGLPFVGPAGQLLDRAFKALDWPREALFLTNAVKHFKYELRGKRRIHKTASQREAAACLHWLESEIDLVRPQAVIALGATAARSLLGRPVGVTAERGRWLARADGLRVLITLHPSALLRLESGDREAAFQAWLTDLSAADGYIRKPGD